MIERLLIGYIQKILTHYGYKFAIAKDCETEWRVNGTGYIDGVTFKNCNLFYPGKIKGATC